MNSSSILNVVPFFKGREHCSSDIRWQNKVAGKSWWRKAVSGQVAMYTKGAFTLEILICWISDQDAEKALNPTVFRLSMCLCTRGMPGSREHANNSSSYDAQKSRQETEVQPWQPSVRCCALRSPAAFEQMQEAGRATYQTDHTRLREQCTRHAHGYSWLFSCGEKEVRGKSSVWEVLRSKDEGAKQCRKCCRLHTLIQGKEKREKREKERYDYGCEMLGKFPSGFTKWKYISFHFPSPLSTFIHRTCFSSSSDVDLIQSQPAHLKYRLPPKGSCSSAELNEAHNSCKMNFKNRLIFSLKTAAIQSVPDFWSYHSPEGQKDLSNRTLNSINDN